jgi:hypothetical protein
VLVGKQFAGGRAKSAMAVRASLGEPVKVQTEKFDFILPKKNLCIAKQLAQNKHCKLKLKMGLFENHHLVHKICHHLLHKNRPLRATRSMAGDEAERFLDRCC